MAQPRTTPLSAKRPPRVALLIETSNAYGRGLLAGVADYVQRHGPWSVYLPEADRAGTAVARLRGWRGDGLLVRAENAATARAAGACGAFVIDLSAAGRLPDAPAVHSDVRHEATMAFEHLWERGFRSLAFCGISDYRWAVWQQQAFTTLAEDRGVRVAAYVRPLREIQSATTTDRRRLVAWLKRLPKPVGIFACYDLRGQQVLDACRSAGFSIPDEVAVVGVDDDDVRCSLSDPPLSSVAPDARGVGMAAAGLLDDMMAGRQVAGGMRLIAPRGVVARRSTDAIAIPDADTAAALRFIRDHACDGLTVQDVLDHVPLSRRSLEARFVKLVGRTPHAEINRCRLDHARRMLRETDLSIKSIAARVGVGTPEYLSVLFQRELGTTPSAYRAGGG